MKVFLLSPSINFSGKYHSNHFKEAVGDLGFDPGSLKRATGEKVTVSEVFPIFRGTHNQQSVLGSWGLLQLERVVQKGILRYLLLR